LWFALACGACSLDTSGTLKPGSGQATAGDPITGTNGGANGGVTGETNGGGSNTSGGVTPLPPIDPGDASVGSDAGSADAGEQDPGDSLAGEYAEKRAFRTQQKVQSGAISSTIRVLTTTYAVVRIAEEGGAYRFYERACRIVTSTESAGSLDIEILINDAVPRSLPELESVFTVTESNGAKSFSRPVTSAPLGWKPASTNDALPTKQDDARVRDSDSDGNPAVTASVRTSGGVLGGSTYEAYYVQWNRTAYEGEVESGGKLTGENFDTTQQAVIGTSNMLPNAGKNSQPVPDADTSDNVITLVPLSEALDCDELVSQIDSIF
jgi:hypothetical protein